MMEELAWLQNPRASSQHLDGRVNVTAGAVTFTGEETFDQPLKPGLKIVALLAGRTSLAVSDSAPVWICAPAVLALYCESETPRMQRFAPTEAYRFALVDLDPDFVRSELLVEPRDLVDCNEKSRGYAIGAADAALQAVASQILACPRRQSHHLYRLSKALELTSLCVEALRPSARSNVRGRLSSSDIARVVAARDFLVEALTDAPDMRKLALRVGLNVRKLNLGFRMMYSMTPYAFLQEHRLQTAYRLLASGERSVGEASHAVGYAPSHLATLFVRRFGVTPRDLIASSSLA